MKQFDRAAVAAALPPEALIEALREAFGREVHAPPREHHALNGSTDRALLLMPAWDSTHAFGVKLVSFYANNTARGLPAVNACYVLFDGDDGSVRAVMDGTELTLRRTGAASALASRYLSRPDSRRLLMVGTGALAPHLVRSHCSMRRIESIRIWGRSPARARAAAQELAGLAPQIEITDDLRSSVQWADIISCATMATDPLIRGEWLLPGQHLDLVGSFTKDMREADTQALQRAHVFVDMRANALADAGEIIQAIESGMLRSSDILADLPELTRGTHAGRRSPQDITVFKSVGHALEDLAAAQLVMASEPGMIRA